MIPWTPKAKQSVRLNKKHFYNPSVKNMYKVKDFVKQDLEGFNLPLFLGPLLIVTHYIIPLPVNSRYKESRNYSPNPKRPDGDNLEKCLNDALTGIVWKDDGQISCLLRTKTYTLRDKGATILHCEELPTTSINFDLVLESIREKCNLRLIDEQT